MIRVFARVVCATQGRERREIVTFFKIDPCSTTNRVTAVNCQLLGGRIVAPVGRNFRERITGSTLFILLLLKEFCRECMSFFTP